MGEKHSGQYNEYFESSLTSKIIGAAIAVHRVLGPGLLEAVYQVCLQEELTANQLPWEAQVNVPVTYRGKRLDTGYRIDLLIDRKVVVELKAVETVLPVHEAQLITYLKVTGCKVGLLINFNVPLLKRGGIMRRAV